MLDCGLSVRRRRSSGRECLASGLRLDRRVLSRRAHMLARHPRAPGEKARLLVRDAPELVRRDHVLARQSRVLVRASRIPGPERQRAVERCDRRAGKALQCASGADERPLRR